MVKHMYKVLPYTGNNLLSIRMEKGLSQREVAELVHTSASVISDVELGKRKPWPKLADALSRVLKVSIENLFPEGIARGRPILEGLPVKTEAIIV